LIEADASQQSLCPLLEQTREQIARKKNYQRTEQRWYIAVQLLEASLQSFAECESGCAIH